jgi:hypothetical protein
MCSTCRSARSNVGHWKVYPLASSFAGRTRAPASNSSLASSPNASRAANAKEPDPSASSSPPRHQMVLVDALRPASKPRKCQFAVACVCLPWLKRREISECTEWVINCIQFRPRSLLPEGRNPKMEPLKGNEKNGGGTLHPWQRTRHPRTFLSAPSRVATAF